MSTLAASRSTIIDRIFARSISRDVVLVVVGVLFTAASAQIQIPTSPVPFTFQTLAVLLIGASYGAARAAITMTAYALVGLAGLPVFAGLSSGAGVIFGATGGFIIGFIFASALAGFLAERNWSINAWKMFLSFVLGSIVIYAIGVPVLAMTAFNSDLIAATQLMLPYLVWDGLKAVIAGTTLPLAWKLTNVIKKS